MSSTDVSSLFRACTIVPGTSCRHVYFHVQMLDHACQILAYRYSWRYKFRYPLVDFLNLYMFVTSTCLCSRHRQISSSGVAQVIVVVEFCYFQVGLTETVSIGIFILLVRSTADIM